jgi:hypothetical protein
MSHQPSNTQQLDERIGTIDNNNEERNELISNEHRRNSSSSQPAEQLPGSSSRGGPADTLGVTPPPRVLPHRDVAASRGAYGSGSRASFSRRNHG